MIKEVIRNGEVELTVRISLVPKPFRYPRCIRRLLSRWATALSCDRQMYRMAISMYVRPEHPKPIRTAAHRALRYIEQIRRK